MRASFFCAYMAWHLRKKYAKIGIRRKIRHVLQTRDFLRIRVFHILFTEIPHERKG